MCSYNRVNGTQTCESKALLDRLKQEWGFTGSSSPTSRSPCATAWRPPNAGVDFPALPGDFTGGLRTREMFTSGQITAARLDDMVRRILFAMFDSGVYDDPVPATPAPVVSTPDHKALATRISESGMVLLKNHDHALPLGGRHLRSLAVTCLSATTRCTSRAAPRPCGHGRAGDHAACGYHGARRAGLHLTSRGVARRRAAAHKVPSDVLPRSRARGTDSRPLLEQRRDTSELARRTQVD